MGHLYHGYNQRDFSPQDPWELDDEETHGDLIRQDGDELMIVLMISYGYYMLLWLGNFFRNEQMLLVHIYIML